MTETDAARLLADLRSRYCVAPYDPTQDVTLEDIMTQLDKTQYQARSLLAAEVAAGRMTSRMVHFANRQRRVWRRKA